MQRDSAKKFCGRLSTGREVAGPRGRVRGIFSVDRNPGRAKPDPRRDLIQRDPVQRDLIQRDLIQRESTQ
ncbi:hypothetical protein GCM10010522_09930 [Kribbella solani]